MTDKTSNFLNFPTPIAAPHPVLIAYKRSLDIPNKSARKINFGKKPQNQTNALSRLKKVAFWCGYLAWRKPRKNKDFVYKKTKNGAQILLFFEKSLQILY